MITARGQATDLSAGKAHGADAYFVKPFSPLKLLSWLRLNLS
jgi:DNA-binding response OmpR family regulator